jgi:hypothetical protein
MTLSPLRRARKSVGGCGNFNEGGCGGRIVAQAVNASAVLNARSNPLRVRLIEKEQPSRKS